MIAVGLGFSTRAHCSDITEAIDAALADRSLKRAEVAVLATAYFKRGSHQLENAAREIGIKLSYVGEPALRRTNDRVVTRSERSQERTGCACLCEAAALAVLDRDAVLIMPRFVHGPVTCAIASGAAP